MTDISILYPTILCDPYFFQDDILVLGLKGQKLKVNPICLNILTAKRHLIEKYL